MTRNQLILVDYFNIYVLEGKERGDQEKKINKYSVL